MKNDHKIKEILDKVLTYGFYELPTPFTFLDFKTKKSNLHIKDRLQALYPTQVIVQNDSLIIESVDYRAAINAATIDAENERERESFLNAQVERIRAAQPKYLKVKKDPF